MLSKEQIAQMTPEQIQEQLRQDILALAKQDPDEAHRLLQKLNPNLVHPKAIQRRPMNRAERRAAKHRKPK